MEALSFGRRDEVSTHDGSLLDASSKEGKRERERDKDQERQRGRDRRSV